MEFRPKILVAEDEPHLQHQLVTTILHMGADPVCVESNEGAQSLLDSQKFDGVFLDWDNPSFSPADLTVAIRKSKSNASIPVAMLSSHPESREIQKAFRAGTTFFLAKPFSSRELEHLLNATRGAMMEERRRYQRVSANVPVLCEWKAGRNSRHVAGRSLNISNTGALVRLNPAPEAGVSVKLEIALPRPHAKVALGAMVVRTGPGDNVALRFLGMTKEQQVQVEEFISKCPATGLFAAS